MAHNFYFTTCYTMRVHACAYIENHAAKRKFDFHDPFVLRFGVKYRMRCTSSSQDKSTHHVWKNFNSTRPSSSTAP